MMTKLFTVELESIHCDKLRSEFSEDDLEVVAQQILAIDGVVRTVVLKKVGFEQYELIDGHFEYYAALKASEINIAQSEINAVVISPEQEDAADIQLEMIHSLNQPQNSSNLIPKKVETEVYLTTMKLDIKNVKVDLKEVKEDVKEVKKQLNTLQNSRNNVDVHDLIHLIQDLKIQIDNLQTNIRSNASKKSTKSKDNYSNFSPKPLEFINTWNQEKIVENLKKSGIRSAKNLSKNIINARNKKENKKFQDYNDVVDSVTGIAKKTMEKIITAWSNF